MGLVVFRTRWHNRFANCVNQNDEKSLSDTVQNPVYEEGI